MLLLKSLLGKILIRRRDCLCLGRLFRSFIWVRISRYCRQIIWQLFLEFKSKCSLFFPHQTYWIFCACPFYYLFLTLCWLLGLKTSKNRGGWLYWIIRREAFYIWSTVLIHLPMSQEKLLNLHKGSATCSSNKATTLNIKQVKDFFYICYLTTWYSRFFILVRVEIWFGWLFAVRKMHLIKIKDIYY